MKNKINEKIDHQRHHDYVCAILQGSIAHWGVEFSYGGVMDMADKMQKAFKEFQNDQ